MVIRAGDQIMELPMVPAFVQQSYGIAGDQKDLLQQLDQEARLLTEQETALIDYAAERESIMGSQDEEDGDELEEDFDAE